MNHKPEYIAGLLIFATMVALCAIIVYTSIKCAPGSKKMAIGYSILLVGCK